MISSKYKEQLHGVALAASSDPKVQRGLVDEFEHIDRAYGNCQACWGKGYSTVRNGTTGYPDFPGDKGFKDPPATKVKFCACGRGQALKNLWGKAKVTDW